MDSYNWEMLLTTSGATAATLLIVQYLKAPLDTIWRIPTRLFVYAIALLVLFGAQAFGAGLTVQAVPLTVVNAFVVALASMGAYENTFKKSDSKPLDIDEIPHI
jgi:hypothetical protein